MTSGSETRFRDIGLLWLRIGMGSMYVMHGWPKVAGGADQWAKLGKAMSHLGIDFLPVMWGFCGAFAEFGGGILLALGVLFRPACAALAFTMVVAATMHLRSGDGLGGASHAIEAGIIFMALLAIGPGRFTLRGRKSVA